MQSYIQSFYISLTMHGYTFNEEKKKQEKKQSGYKYGFLYLTVLQRNICT